MKFRASSHNERQAKRFKSANDIDGSISVEGLLRSSVLPRLVRLPFRLEGDRLAIGNKRWPVDFPARDRRPILFNR
jgi:hypothetical protein